MICAYAKNGSMMRCFELFVQMLERGVRPDSYTFSGLLKASAEFGFLELTLQLHSMVVRVVHEARKLFDRMVVRDVASWSAMIQACSSMGSYADSMALFSSMQLGDCLKPNELTVVALNGYESNLIIGSALVTMYSRCGDPDVAYMIFTSFYQKNLVLWTSMIEGFALNGNHAGFVDEGLQIFETMQEKFGVKAGVEHYACVVDMLGRGGRLEDAEKLFELEPRNAANYVILSNVYAALKDTVYVFGAHDRSHWESEKIYKVLEELSEEIVRAGYVPATEHVLLDVEENEKKKLLCSHSERLAIAFGLLKVPPEMPIRIVKNLRVCGDCHEAIKLISRVTSRKLVVRDTNRFHHFYRGCCSCGDYW
ncbi:hypothetical protein B296_00002472 [Ensete ventricosum]|uniref:DYW domain-containing protein n=1 Tax=Ensete ventricosum TaxID=4639 RepID=A0A427B560_ENSVE|nr:hypothetical protein B296_00002472 [Ensete ventricosum]